MKKLFLIVTMAILIAGGAFYAGTKYGQSKNQGAFSQTDFQNLRSLSPEERQKRIQELGTDIGAGSRVGQAGQGFVNGEIIAKDENAVTVKLRDGGSKIVFYSDSTKINKLIDGALGDLEIGKTIAVSGKTNTDGSVTADSFQLLP